MSLIWDRYSKWPNRSHSTKVFQIISDQPDEQRNIKSIRKDTGANYTSWISDHVYPTLTSIKIFVFIKTVCWLEMCNAECGSVKSDSEQQNMPAMLLYNFEIDFILNLKWFSLLRSFVYCIQAKCVFFIWQIYSNTNQQLYSFAVFIPWNDVCISGQFSRPKRKKRSLST